jgi:hypothetical protein
VSSPVFGVKGFTAWVVIGMIWVFVASFIVVIYPLYESREGIMEVSNDIRVRILLDLTISSGSPRHEKRLAIVGFWQVGPRDIHIVLEDLSSPQLKPSVSRIIVNRAFKSIYLFRTPSSLIVHCYSLTRLASLDSFPDCKSSDLKLVACFDSCLDLFSRLLSQQEFAKTDIVGVAETRNPLRVAVEPLATTRHQARTRTVL